MTCKTGLTEHTGGPFCNCNSRPISTGDRIPCPVHEKDPNIWIDKLDRK